MISPNFFTQVIENGSTYGKFTLEPLPLSFGQSMGNALRRILLSSLEGAAVTQIKIEGAPHLFETLKGVKESVLEIVLNMKQLRFEATKESPFRLSLSAKTKGKIYAKDIESEVKIVNEDLYIGEITDPKGRVELEAIGEVGMGYVPVEERETNETGFIPVDSFFSPVKKVSFKVEEARVGRKSNMDKLTFEVWTDGSVKPVEALRQASQILSQYFGHVLSGKDTPQPKTEVSVAQEQEQIDKKLYEVIIDELNLPSRVINALLRENIETVADLVKVGKAKLTDMKGVGKKSIELIEEELKKMGIILS